MADVVLDGYPPVLSMQYYQTSDERPGKAIVETVLLGSAEEVANLPRLTDMHMYGRNFTGKWKNMRLVSTPKIAAGRMRMVLEDCKWRFRYGFLSNNYNQLAHITGAGGFSPFQLAEIIFDAADMDWPLVLEGDQPDIFPTANWAGVRCDKALKWLLDNSGCRMVYDEREDVELFRFGLCGQGNNLLGLDGRIFRAGPKANVRYLRVRSGPVIYSKIVPIEAEDIGNLPTTYTDESSDSRNKKWRINWDSVKVQTNDGEEFVGDGRALPYRLKIIIEATANNGMAAPVFIPDEWEQYPVHSKIVNESFDLKHAFDGSGDPSENRNALYTEHPMLMREKGSHDFHDQAMAHIAFYRGVLRVSEWDAGRNFSDWDRLRSDILIDETANKDIDINAEWMRPYISHSTRLVWQQGWDAYAENLARRYRGPSSHFRLSSPKHFRGSIYLGGLQYQFDIRNKAKLWLWGAISYTPTGFGKVE